MAARQRASILAMGPHSSPSINVNVEGSTSDSESSTATVALSSSAAADVDTPDSNMPMDTDTPAPNALAVLESPTTTDTPEPDPPVVLSEHYTESHKGVMFYLPMAGVPSPYYLVTKGRAIGIIAQWFVHFILLRPC